MYAKACERFNLRCKLPNLCELSSVPLQGRAFFNSSRSSDNHRKQTSQTPAEAKPFVSTFWYLESLDSKLENCSAHANSSSRTGEPRSSSSHTVKIGRETCRERVCQEV